MSFIQKGSLSIYYVPGIMLGLGIQRWTKRIPCSHRVYILVGWNRQLRSKISKIYSILHDGEDYGEGQSTKEGRCNFRVNVCLCVWKYTILKRKGQVKKGVLELNKWPIEMFSLWMKLMASSWMWFCIGMTTPKRTFLVKSFPHLEKFGHIISRLRFTIILFGTWKTAVTIYFH